MKLEKQVALITGASQGLGLAIAKQLAAEGAAIAVVARAGAKLDEAVATIIAAGGRAIGVPADVTRAAEVKAAVKRTLAQLGRLDIVVLNAGTWAGAPVVDTTEESWDALLGLNLKGAFLVTRAVLPLMRGTSRGGRGGYVVNIASISGKQGMPGAAAYCASKFGLVGFSESLLKEEKPNGIRATAICPGYVATPLVAGAEVPESEMIQPEDIAASVLYLLDLGPKVIVRELVIERVGGF